MRTLAIMLGRTMGLSGLAALGVGCAVSLAQSLDTILSQGLSEPYGVAVDAENLYYLTDSANNRIARLTPDTGVLTNFAGVPGPIGGYQDGAAVVARFYSPEGIVMVPGRGGMVVADSGNHLLRLVKFDGTVSTLAGGGAGFQDGSGLAARFRAPAGLATDAQGNIYVADLQNHAVRKVAPDNSVTTLATNLFRPSAVAVDPAGRVYVADTGNHCIKTIDDSGSVRLLAGSGSRLLFGLLDAPNASEALFDNPGSLLWVGGAVGLLVGDSENHLLRRVYYSSQRGTNSVETYLASAGPVLGNPTGLGRDLNGTILIVDLGADRLLGVRGAVAANPPVAAPQIGYVVVTNLTTEQTLTGTRLYGVTNATFNNDVTVAILSETATQTYFSLGPGDAPEGLPDPTPADSVPPAYTDGASVLPRSIVEPIQPDVLIKAIGTAPDRRPSPVVSARFRFQVANPVIYGVNPASFTLDSATAGADLWFTTDGTAPAENGSTARLYAKGTHLNVLNGTNDVLFKVRGFKRGYAPSAVVQSSFSFTNVQTSSIGILRDFRGSPGATLVVPVDVRLAASDVLQSLQFRIEVRPNGAAPSLTGPLNLVSFGPSDFLPSARVSGIPTYLSRYAKGTAAGLAVAFIGTDALPRLEDSGTVAMLAVPVPPSALAGQTYSLVVREASGTPDGGQALVGLSSLLDRTLLVTNLAYLVGDTAAAQGYNAGDFGDGDLNNNDVNNAFFASLGVRMPPPFTDAFDAMDAFPVDTPTQAGGDGQIRFLDWQVTLERSLRLRKDVWERTRGPGGVRVAGTGHLVGGSSPAPGGPPASPGPGVVWDRQVKLVAGTVEFAKAGDPVQVPIYVSLVSGANLAGLQFWPVISLRRDSSDSEVQSTFTPNADGGIATPSANSVPGFSPYNVAYVWDSGKLNPPLVGSNLLGWLTFQVPPSAPNGAGYTVRFANADGAPKEDILYEFETVPGTVWVHTAALRPAERISDEWRKKFFNSIVADNAQAGANPDRDGLSNLGEYLIGTDPTRADWRISVRREADRVLLRWYGETGRTYQLFESGNLTAWTPLGAAQTGSDTWLELPDQPVASAARFYRIQVLP